MTVQVKEQVASREFSGSQNSRQAIREWLVYDDTAGTVLTKGQVLAQTGVPKPYNIHPDDPELRAVDPPEVVAIDERNYTWRVRWNYRVIGVPSVVGAEKGEDEVGFQKIEMKTSGAFIDAWRTWWPNADNSNDEYDLWNVFFNFPQRGDSPGENNGNWNLVLDIRGKPIDSRGDPVSISVVTAEVTVTQVVSGPLPPSLLTLYGNLTNQRSSEPFLQSFPPGATLYAGNTLTRVGPRVWRIVHRFIVDDWFHMRQIVQMQPDGKTAIGLPDASHSYAGHGYKVTFIQPFPRTADFRILGI